MPEDTRETRVDAPPEKWEVVKTRRMLFPLRLKLLSAFSLAALVLGWVVLNAEYIPAFREYAIVGIIVLTLIVLYALVEGTLILPLRALLKWFRAGREQSFAHVAPLPVSSHDELGRLSQEMSAAISRFWSSEKRVEGLLALKRDTITLIEHQLRTPLTGLLWSLERVNVPDDVKAAVLRVETTVRAIIEASLIEEGKYGYVFAKFDMVPLVEKMVARFKSFADSKKVDLSFEHVQDLLPVRADEERIAAVLANLLSNAIDYTPNGGSVQVSATEEGKNIKVSIMDSGIGIPKEEMALIFTKLYRGANAKRMRPDGSGLGLFVSKNILHAHGSDISIRSAERQGTEVSFVLPAA